MKSKSTLSKLFKLSQIILAFFKFYTFLVIFSPIIFIFALYRLSLSLIFLIFYGGRYKLMGSAEGLWGIDSYANVLTISYFVHSKGEIDLKELKNRFETTFLNFRDQKTGQKPYEKLLCAIVPKWGFMCYENTRKTFDISKHVYICPGFENPREIHTEADVLDKVAKITDDLWDQHRPRWEVLVFPQVKPDNSPNDLRNIICLRFHHAYLDGVSFAQLCRNVLFDQPCPTLCFDPVNPNLPTIPWYVRFWWWIVVAFVGPYATSKLLNSPEEHVFYEGPLTGNKFIGKSQNPISIPVMKCIRDTFGVCTSAVQHSAYLGALSKMAELKGFQVPQSVIAAAVFANLPYPNEYPTNHIQFVGDRLPMGIPNSLKRLSIIDQIYKTMAASMPEKLASELLIRIVGQFPAALVKNTFGKIRFSYAVSNVPGISLPAKLQGNEVPLFYGVGPIANGIRYSLGVGVYDNHFQFGFQFEHSNLIRSRTDVEQFIQYFDSEIEYLYSVTQISYK